MVPIDEFLKKLRPGEPIFCLRAGDKFAPEIIERWAQLVDAYDKQVVEEVRIQSSRRSKIKEAKALAHQMRAWQELNGSKIPD